MGEIARYLETYPRQTFSGSSGHSMPLSGSTAKPRLNDTARETLKLFRAGQSVEDIASRRQLTASTIYNHLATAIEAGEGVDLTQFFSSAELEAISAAFAKCGPGNLTGVHQTLGARHDFGALRVYRAAQARQRAG